MDVSASNTTPDLPRCGPRGIAVLLFGHKLYLELTKKLAMSIRLNSPGIPLAVITSFYDPELKELFDFVLPYEPDFGYGVIQKLSIDRYAPFDETVFIDCDCLVFGAIDDMWDKFKNVSVGVVGDMVQKGYWYTDIQALCKKTGHHAIPRTNTGLVYVRRCEESARVFERARQLIPEYADMGFHAFRDHISDEPLIALALAEQGIEPVHDDKQFYVTVENVYGPFAMDVMKGFCRFDTYSFDTGKMELIATHGRIVHFPGRNREQFIYKRELWKLNLWHYRKWKPGSASLLVNVACNPFYAAYAFVARSLKTVYLLNKRRPAMPYAIWFRWP